MNVGAGDENVGVSFEFLADLENGWVLQTDEIEDRHRDLCLAGLHDEGTGVKGIMHTEGWPTHAVTGNPNRFAGGVDLGGDVGLGEAYGNDIIGTRGHRPHDQ